MGVKGDFVQVKLQIFIYYYETENFARSGISSTPENGKVWYNYGNYLKDREDSQGARLCYKEALR